MIEIAIQSNCTWRHFAGLGVSAKKHILLKNLFALGFASLARDIKS